MNYDKTDSQESVFVFEERRLAKGDKLRGEVEVEGEVEDEREKGTN